MEAGPRDSSERRDVRGTPFGDVERVGVDAGATGSNPRADDDGAATGALPDDVAAETDETEAAPESGGGAESFRDLRPPRRLRIWQLAPIVAIGAVGSLMFAFPLAFEFGDGGAVVAMLGLLLCGSAAGGGMMAARRVGLTWPGLSPRGPGRRPYWLYTLLYAVLVALLATLAIWRVARLR